MIGFCKKAGLYRKLKKQGDIIVIPAFFWFFNTV